MKWLILLLLGGNMAMAADLEVIVQGLRSKEGKLAASLFHTDARTAFPRDVKRAVATKYIDVAKEGEALIKFENVAPGTYALSLMHDENGDGKMNMRLGIPLEGFGFSNNPTIYFGPPSFDKASFKIGESSLRLDVRMKYLL